MASLPPPPLFQANALCQLLNNYGAPKFPIAWNSKEKVWDWAIEKTISQFFLTTLLIKGGIFLLQIVILFWSNQYSGQLDFTQHACNVLCILLMIISITADLIVYKDGLEVTLATNWALARENLLISSDRGGNPKFRQTSYFLGMMFNLSITAIHVLIIMVLTSADLDPLHLAALCFYRKMLRESLLRKIFKIVRLILMLIFGLFCATNLRTMFITTFTHGFYKFTLIRNMATWKPTKVSIRYYRECQIATNCLDDFSYKVSVVVCGACFIVICAAVNGVMVGKDSGSPILIVTSGCIISGCLIALQFLFVVGGALYIYSKEVLGKWTEEAGRARGSRVYFKKVVKSLPTISMICGDFGIIDKDIKMNYLDNLLGCVVDGIMARNNLLKI